MLMPRSPTPGDAWTRQLIALVVVGASLVAVAAISGLAIGFAKDRTGASRLVFTSVLPVLGTWVGTVLAFYFARENLEAATSSTLALTGREREVSVVDVMIHEADFVTYDLAAGGQPESVKLSAVRAQMAKVDPPSRRLPIRDPARAVLYVIHDSTLSAFADKHHKTIDQIADLTIGDLLKDSEYKEILEANGFVSRDATVAEARTVMSSITHCNDVFVTASGKRDERAIGWLTNTLLAGVQ
jgi:hypothetical protein